MARPQKQTVDYFPHHVSDGKTKLILQNEFGNDGYAFWYQLLELLCESENQVYDYNNPPSWRLLLAKTHVTEDIAINILQLLADLGTIDPELHKNKIIWSQNLVENLELVYRRRATGTPERPVIANMKAVNVNNNRQTKLNNTKLNNTKVEATPPASFVAYKEKLITTFPELDIDTEWERCQIWYRDHNKAIKSPSLALGNWCGKEREIRMDKKGGQNGAYRGHSTKLIPREQYTKPRRNLELEKLVEQQREADKLAGRNQPG